MGIAVFRSLAAACAAGIAACGTAAAAPPPPVPPLPPPCAAQVAVSATDAATTGNAHRLTVVLSATGSACTLGGFPVLVLPSAPAAPLPVGHLTVAQQPVVLAAGLPASFEVRYSTSQAPAEPCSVGVVVNGVATGGTLPIAECASVTQIDVTGYARGTHPPPVATLAPPAAHVATCDVHDFDLREIRTVPAGAPAPDAIYAVQNRGSAPCRIASSIGVQLFGADGAAFALHFEMRRMLAMIVTLPPGYEGSFTVAYAPPAPARCATSTSIAVYVAAQTTPLTAPATLMACTSGNVRVGNLRLGVPLPAGIAMR